MSADPTVDAETTGAADAAESAAGGADGSEALPDTALSFGDAPLLSAADV
ncbi:corrinoid ABC transporter AT-binding protein, partial [Halorubrum sp. SD626R]